MEKHVKIVALLHIGFGFLGIIAATIVYVAVVGGGIISGDHEAMFITSIVGTVIAGFLTFVSLPGIIGGFGLLQHRSWAKILLMIIACIELIEIPVGTLIGGYSLWVLLNDETEKIFADKPEYRRSTGQNMDETAQV